MGLLGELVYATVHTVKDNLESLYYVLGAPRVQKVLHSVVPPQPSGPKWLLERVIQPVLAEDGAVLSGPRPANAYAKYALPKGLPQDSTKRSLAIENEPHLVDDFDGVIESGYGKGTKTLLAADSAIVKVKGRTFPGRFNYHYHAAEVAGPHFDLVVEGLKPGTAKWELHIPRGPYKGRFAFNTTTQGVIVTPMKDRGLILPKPDYTLKDVEFLKNLSSDRGRWLVEQKLDGSLGNAVINDQRVAFRSHRDTGSTYYDRLPALEHVENRSPFWTCRALFPGPDQNGTVLVGELFHPDGAARVGGILNAHPEKARQIQQLRGDVTYHVWDILKLKGRDLSHLPHGERRAIAENVVAEIRLFNKNWNIVPKAQGDPYAFYQKVITKALPEGEGVVIKDAFSAERKYFKVKQSDFTDLTVVGFVEGSGKYAGSLGALLVEEPNTGTRAEVGSFAINDDLRQWIWDHRDILTGSVAKVRVQEVTSRGAPRAGVFIAFHEGKGTTEAGLAMYAESLAGGDPEESENMRYALKSAAGWRR